MTQKINDEFMYLCKASYAAGLTPISIQTLNNPNNKEMIRIATIYFKDNQYDLFANFFYEGQYFIDLFAAHLILQYGKPQKALADRSINIIKKYAEGSLSPHVAKEEKDWLKIHEGLINN